MPTLNPKRFALALKKVLETSNSPRPFDELPAALVACSGGVDSMVLLDLARAHYESRRQSQKLAVCYVDHGQRPKAEIARDIDVVRAYCRRHKLPLAVERLESPKAGESEAALRKARYGRLAEVAARYPNPEGRPAVVLTAHHQDDEVETLLFRLIRGTHPSSLRGIAPRARRRLTGSVHLQLARPMLSLSKAALVDYAKKAGLEWHEDSTNAKPTHARNRVRHELLPLLESLRPGAAKRLALFLAERATRARPRKTRRTDATAVTALTQKLASGEGCPVTELQFTHLKAALDSLLDEHAGRTTRAHWDSLKRQLRSRHAAKAGGGPEKTIQFPGKNALCFRGTRAFWISTP